MRSHRFINSLLYLVIQLVVKESNAKENNARIRCLFVLFLEKRYITQAIHFNQPLFIIEMKNWCVPCDLHFVLDIIGSFFSSFGLGGCGKWL